MDSSPPTTPPPPPHTRGQASGPKAAAKASNDCRSNWQKTLDIYRWSKFLIKCNNPEHFTRSRENVYEETNWDAGRKNAVPVTKPPKEIVLAMEYAKEAKCACERAACEYMWEINPPGLLQSQFVLPGKYSRGCGEISPGVMEKRVMPLHFNMRTDQFKVLHERFPAWHFVSVKTGMHDHPISHVTTQIATFELLDKMPTRSKILDLHGNPTANDSWMRNHSQRRHDIKTFVNLVTAKDVYRSKTKWGPQYGRAPADYMRPAAGEQYARWHTGPYIRDFDQHNAAVGEGRDQVISIHTGYYYSPAEIASVMRSTKSDAKFTMIMHRFKGNSGTLNAGELVWQKSGNTVTQRNAGTDESYSHPDNDMWFTQSSWTDVRHEDAARSMIGPDGDAVPNPDFDTIRGLTWSRGMVCDDVYIITVVGCTAQQAHMDETRNQSSVMGTIDQVVKDGGVHVGDGFIPVRPQHAALFDELRAGIALRPRTELKFQAHVATTSAKCKGYLRDKNVVVDSQDQHDLALGSFWVDFPRDCGVASNLLVTSQWQVKQHQLLLQGKSLAQARNTATLVLGIVGSALRAKGGKATVTAIIDSIEALSSKAL